MLQRSTHKMADLMDRILEVRYTDLEQERALCQRLQAWAEAEHDAYGQAFARTYLGDFYLAVCDESTAGEHLAAAQELLEEDACWDELRLRIFGLLGLYHSMCTNEQKAIEYYLKTINVAERLNDVHGQCMALNNMAFIFQRHRCHQQALEYFERAFRLQETMEDSPFQTTLLSNLAEAHLLLGQLEEAKACMDACQLLGDESSLGTILRDKNWCGYYAAAGQPDRAMQYARLLLERQDIINEDRLTAFDLYYALCEKMMELSRGREAGAFLQAMEAVSDGGGLDRQQQLEELRIRYAIGFQPPETHAAAYRRFYEKDQRLRGRTNEAIIDAMKAKIYLEQLMQQARQLQSEHETLSQEVNRDALTGIYNRKFFEEKLRAWSDGCAAEGLSLVVLDIDYFKEYNDRYGHIQGDTALRETAQCLMACAQAGIYPCRYGGDEFVCICEALSAAAVEAYILRVRQLLEGKAIAHEASSCADQITLSIGYAVSEMQSQTEVHLLFQLADQALYQSKRSGRNTYTRNRANAL